MAMAKEITIKLFVDGNEVDTLSADQRESMARRLGERMSVYYSNHINEYQNLNRSNKNGKKEI